MKEVMTDIFQQEISKTKMRRCQAEAFQAAVEYFADDNVVERNVLLQLPTGAGKTALIAALPFGLNASKVLVLCPGVKLAGDIAHEMDTIANKDHNAYKRFDLLRSDQLAGTEFYTLKLDATANAGDIGEHHIIVANYQQLQDIERWFGEHREEVDLVIIDEAHHQKAGTYQEIISFFDKAKVVGLTATPFRSDGQKLNGKIIYKYHFHEAIRDDVIRNIRVDNVSPEEIELAFNGNGSRTYTLQDVLEMREQALFRQGVAMSQDCCDTIARRAKGKLDELCSEYPNTSHQIIAAAMSKRQAREFVKPAFEKLGLKVGLVSSDELDKPNNDSVFQKLNQGKINVIIHIGMLGEGFDHPPLGVAAIFRPFRSLNPYIQFIGRVLRKNGNTPHCYVVSHVGLNQMERFQEFKLFDYEDQEFLKKILETAEQDTFVPGADKEGEDIGRERAKPPTVHELGSKIVEFSERFVDENRVEALADEVAALKPEEQALLLKKLGLGEGIEVNVSSVEKRIKPKDKRRASKSLLNEREKSIATDILKELELKHKGRNFNRMFENFVWVKRRVSQEMNKKLGIKSAQRNAISNDTFQKMEEDGVLEAVKQECTEYFAAKIKEKARS